MGGVDAGGKTWRRRFIAAPNLEAARHLSEEGQPEALAAWRRQRGTLREIQRQMNDAKQKGTSMTKRTKTESRETAPEATQPIEPALLTGERSYRGCAGREPEKRDPMKQNEMNAPTPSEPEFVPVSVAVMNGPVP